MSEIQTAPAGIKTGKSNWSFLIALIVAIPVYLTIYFYTDAVIQRYQFKIALLVTTYIFSGVYIGRYLSQIWIIKHRSITNSLFILLVLVILASLFAFFFIAEIMLTHNGNFLKILFLGIPLLVLSMSSGMLIKLVRSIIKKQLQDAQANMEQSQSELKFLQTQLSPHFLFNTLNNIYGISLSQHDKIPGLILKLSSLLRYSVYDAKELYVLLKNELDYINNYIDFEKIRIGDKLVLNVSFDNEIDPGIKIAPLLLIVFIENAFKHGKNTTEQKIFIDITIKIWGNFILFSVKNSNSGISDENSILNKNSGFGLDNVVKRMDLLYRNEYDLKIQNNDGFYNVMLQLKVK